MSSQHQSLFTRDDTFFGVCEALGEDFGFNPNYLRLVLAGGLLWNPAAVLAVYLVLGSVVAATRWLRPDPKAAAETAASVPSNGANDDAAPEELAKAA